MTPDWFERLVKKSSRHSLEDFAGLDAIYRSKHVIRQDRFDGRKYNEVARQAEDLDDLHHRRAIDDPSWPHLIQDAYLALWKAHPDLLGQNEVLPSHLVNQATMDRILTDPDYEQLRTWTRLDDWSSVMGTLSLATKLEDLFDEQKDLMNKQQELAQQEQQLRDMMAQLQREAEKGMSDSDLERFLDDLEGALSEMQDAAQEFQEEVDSAMPSIRSAARQGLDAALEAAEETEDLIMSFGTDPGQWTRLDANVRMQLARRLHAKKKLQEIAKMLGRMKRMAVGQWTQRVIHGVDEVYDVEIGRDLSRLVPTELAYLADPELEDVFYAKYAEGNLQQYELRGTEKQARGAIIALLDNSGSMGGEREYWGKAVALSLLEIAKREGRDFYGIHFGSPHEHKEWFFPKGEVDLNDVLDYAEFFFNGGTDFMTPLNRAIKVLEEQFRVDGATRGDIIMITDGECSVNPDWLDAYLEAKQELDFSTYGMLIGRHAQVLGVLSDKVYTIQEVMTGEDIKDVFSLI